jgi:hypothetical protein
MWYNKPWAQLAAFIIGLVIMAVALKGVQAGANNKLYKTQLAACYRGNKIRQENNDRAKDHEKQDQVIRIILVNARNARLATWRRDHNAEDLRAYQGYVKGLKLSATIKFSAIPLVDCQKAIAKP